MWLAGILALCQVTFLPGAAIFRYLRVRGLNVVERITGLFAASLITNCILVSLLVGLHLHVAWVWWTIIPLEILYLALTWKSRAEPWKIDLKRIGALRSLSFEAAFSAILLLAGALVIGYALYLDWGAVYTANDDVGNWDRWATEWSQNKLPELTSIYPQLLPTNSSISYVLVGTSDVKMFAKAIVPVFDLLPVLLFLSLAIRRRDASYLIGGALCAWFWIHYLGMAFMLYGYADVPLAFFGFLTFYCVYRGPGVPDRRAVMAGLIASFGALLTKQGGIYVVAAMAGYAVYWTLRQPTPAKPALPHTSLLRRDSYTTLLLAVAGFCVLWYAGKYYQVYRHTEYLQMSLLTQGLHEGRSYAGRIFHTARLLQTCRLYTGPFMFYSVAALLLGSLFLKHTRAVALFFLLPFLLLYSMFFSYEIRNAAVAFPLVALVCGETLHKWVSMIPRLSRGKGVNAMLIAAIVGVCIGGWFLAGQQGRESLPQDVIAFLTSPWITQVIDLYAPAIFVSAALCLILAAFVRVESGVLELGKLTAAAAIVWILYGALIHPRESIIAAQTQAAYATIGDPVVNTKLRDVVLQRQIVSAIVTDYWSMRALPDVRAKFRRTTCGGPCSVSDLRSQMKLYPDAGFMLMADRDFTPETREILERGGEFTTLLTVNGYRFIEVNRSASPLAQDH